MSLLTSMRKTFEDEELQDKICLVVGTRLVGSDPKAIVEGVGKRVAKVLLNKLHERYRARGKAIEPYLSLGNWGDVLKALRSEVGEVSSSGIAS